MEGVTIHDHERSRPLLSFDLVDVLDAIGPLPGRWSLHDVEAFGDGAGALHALSDAEAVVEHEELTRLARSVDQVVEGTFTYVDPTSGGLALEVRAIDSTLFQVCSSDGAILERVRATFRDVRDVPPGSW